MVLKSLGSENGLITTRWQLTYKPTWAQLLKAVAYAHEYYGVPVVLSGFDVFITEKPEDVLKIPEDCSAGVRGMSKVLDTEVNIRFHNGAQTVMAEVKKDSDEFASPDYQKICMALGQYMDSLELAMYQ